MFTPRPFCAAQTFVLACGSYLFLDRGFELSMTTDLKKSRPKAVLVGIQLPGVSEAEHRASLDELERLCHTLGFDTVAKISQTRKALEKGTALGAGKLQELARVTGGSGVIENPAQHKPSKAKLRQMEEDEEALGAEWEELAEEESEEDSELDPALEGVTASVVVFDNEITPMQMRNIESATGVEVLDRAGVIVEIFSRHAQTREARLQVEIAKLNYLAPRLRLSRVGGDRQGGGMQSKSSGETAHELDRRRIRDRIAELKRQLEVIGLEQANRRLRRKDSLRVALVGYTNAGKSSLMRALTGSEVLVADKLFATLDTTVRTLFPETQPKILVSDTVGFIKKLPHDLVASFRSTLDEALSASLLLYVVDASDETFRSQLEVTRTVLAEIGATGIDALLVLNKADRLDEATKRALMVEFPDAIMISTREKKDVASLREQLIRFFEKDMEDFTIEIPYEKSALIGELRSRARVVSEDANDTAMIYQIRTHKGVFEKLVEMIAVKN